MSKPVAGTSGANSAGLIIKVNITASKQDIDSAYVTLQNYVSKKPPLEINAKLRDDVVKNINVQIGALNSKTLNKVELLGKLNKTATEDQIRKQVGKWAKPISIPVGVTLEKASLSDTVNELTTFINNVRKQVDEDVKLKVRVDFEDIKKDTLDKEIKKRAEKEAKAQADAVKKANKQQAKKNYQKEAYADLLKAQSKQLSKASKDSLSKSVSSEAYKKATEKQREELKDVQRLIDGELDRLSKMDGQELSKAKTDKLDHILKRSQLIQDNFKETERKIDEVSKATATVDKTASNEEKLKQQRKYNALIEEEIRLIKQSMSASKSADKSTFYKDYTANQRTKLQSIERELSAARQGIALKDGVVVDVNTAELDKLITKSQDALREMRLLDAQAHSIELAPKSATNAMQVFDKLGNRMTEYFKKHGNEIKKNAQLYDQYRTIYNKLNAGDYATVSDASAAFSQFRMECRKAGVEVDTFGNLLRKTFDTRVRSYISNIGVMQLEMALRDIVRIAIEVDTAMTELKKVTNETDATYASFLNNATERAAKLGATLTEVVNATAD